jgi:hypothetical protein
MSESNTDSLDVDATSGNDEVEQVDVNYDDNDNDNNSGILGAIASVATNTVAFMATVIATAAALVYAASTIIAVALLAIVLMKGVQKAVSMLR